MHIHELFYKLKVMHKVCHVSAQKKNSKHAYPRVQNHVMYSTWYPFISIQNFTNILHSTCNKTHEILVKEIYVSHSKADNIYHDHKCIPTSSNLSQPNTFQISLRSNNSSHLQSVYLATVILSSINLCFSHTDQVPQPHRTTKQKIKL